MRLRCLLYPAGVLFAAFSAFGNLAPEALTPAPVLPTLRSGGTVEELDLGSAFRDPDVNTAVRVGVRIGSTVKNVDLVLFEQTQPITVANFLAYVNSGRHNENFFHRSVPGFVVQGGGFKWNAAGGVDSVVTDPKIQNEPGRSNLRGTIAMAKLGGDANSATSQWFVNLADNSANLDAQNGGFTVFGRVAGTGMAVVDEVAALPRVNAGGAFDTLPVKDFTGGNIQRVHTVETNSAVLFPLSFTAVSSDPSLVSVSVAGKMLRLTPGATRSGTATVSVTATDLDGASTQANFAVTVRFGLVSTPEVNVSGAQAGAPVPTVGSEGLPAGSVLGGFGTPAISDFRHLAARVNITAGRTKFAGIYLEDGAGESRLVAVQTQAAGIAGATFKSFRDPLLAPGGAIAFAAKLAGPKASEDEGVWTDLFGNLAPVLREGSAIPGVDGLKLKSVTSLSISDQMLIALVKLSRGVGGVTAASDTALIQLTGANSGILLARTGAVFEETTIKMLSVLQPAAGSAGQGRWHGTSSVVARLTLADKRTVAVRFSVNGTSTKLLQSGAEDTSLGRTLAKLGLPALGDPSVAVAATLAKGDGVTTAVDEVLLYSADGLAFTEAVHESDIAEDISGPVAFAGFGDPVTNDQGEMLFSATLRGIDVQKSNQSGLWVTSGGATPVLVARIGTPATDKEGNPLVDTTWGPITSYALPDGPNAGPIFLAKLKGRAITAQNNLGLWGVDSTGSVRLLLQTGEEITVAAGQKRLTKMSLLNALPGSFGARRSYNATGSLAVHATFSDKTQAILRIDLP